MLIQYEYMKYSENIKNKITYILISSYLFKCFFIGNIVKLVIVH